MRLCLLGDLAMTVRDDSSVHVSRYETTGSEMTMGAPFMKSSCRSLRQISMCSSPQPAMMCSPEYFIVTMGCDSVASASAMVPALTMYWSMPTSAHVLPAVTDSTASVLRPIMRMVRCTLL